jgi:hypothetical protein
MSLCILQVILSLSPISCLVAQVIYEDILVLKRIMATAMDRDKLSTEQQHTENVEKISDSSGELEAQNVVLEEKEAARVLRKVDMRLVPILTLLYLVAFIDRSNSTYILTQLPTNPGECC